MGWADGKGFMDILSHSNSTRYHLREFAPWNKTSSPSTFPARPQILN